MPAEHPIRTNRIEKFRQDLTAKTREILSKMRRRTRGEDESLPVLDTENAYPLLEDILRRIVEKSGININTATYQAKVFPTVNTPQYPQFLHSDNRPIYLWTEPEIRLQPEDGGRPSRKCLDLTLANGKNQPASLRIEKSTDPSRANEFYLSGSYFVKDVEYVFSIKQTSDKNPVYSVSKFEDFNDTGTASKIKLPIDTLPRHLETVLKAIPPKGSIRPFRK